MKRILALCLILTLLLSLCACGQQISEEEAIAIAIEEVISRTGLELTEDMAVCEKVLGRYRVTVQTYELNTPVEVTVNARTGEIEKYRVHPIVVALE